MLLDRKLLLVYIKYMYMFIQLYTLSYIGRLYDGCILDMIIIMMELGVEHYTALSA